MHACRSTLEDPTARSLIERELATYERDAGVALTLRSVGSRQVWLLGRFESPGVYPMTGPLTLLEASALAGGALAFSGDEADYADLRRGFVVREGRVLPVDLHRLLREGDASQNVYLKPDDFVYLPSAETRDIYVLGAVRSPRPIDPREGPTLISALAAAGGTVKNAYVSHIAIVRGSLSDPKIAVVDVREILRGKASNVRLQPQDIVYVPFSPYRKLSEYADLVLNTFARAVGINEGVRAVSNHPIPVGVNIGVGLGIP